MMRLDVYDQLKERLFTGDLRTGQFVSHRELTDLLGATLTPVREAIRKLEAEGLINIYAQKGIQIIEGGPKAINDAYEYRLLLELNAVRHFAAEASKEQIIAQIAKIEASLRLLEASPDNDKVALKVLDDDFQFHKDLVDFQQNQIMSKHYSLNAARLRIFRINLGHPIGRLDSACREHLEILQACLRREPDIACKLLSDHIGISREHALGIRPMRKVPA